MEETSSEKSQCCQKNSTSGPLHLYVGPHGKELQVFLEMEAMSANRDLLERIRKGVDKIRRTLMPDSQGNSLIPNHVLSYALNEIDLSLAALDGRNPLPQPKRLTKEQVKLACETFKTDYFGMAQALNALPNRSESLPQSEFDARLWLEKEFPETVLTLYGEEDMRVKIAKRAYAAGATSNPLPGEQGLREALEQGAQLLRDAIGAFENNNAINWSEFAGCANKLEALAVSIEDYPGQRYFHENNANIRRAERAAAPSEQATPRYEPTIAGGPQWARDEIIEIDEEGKVHGDISGLKPTGEQATPATFPAQEWSKDSEGRWCIGKQTVASGEQAVQRLADALTWCISHTRGHEVSCNLNQQDRWDEAQQALSDCPQGPDTAHAQMEINAKRNECTCGYWDGLKRAEAAQAWARHALTSLGTTSSVSSQGAGKP